METSKHWLILTACLATWSAGCIEIPSGSDPAGYGSDDVPQPDAGPGPGVAIDEPGDWSEDTQAFSPLDDSNDLVETWRFEQPGLTTDSVELGVSPSSGTELIVLMEGTGNYCGAELIAPGQLAVLDTDGNTRTSYTANAMDLIGVPLPMDTDGDGDSEYIVCESAHYAPCRALDSDLSTTLWSTGDGFCAGSWNMGPSAGNVVTGSAGDEVVIPDWNGDVLVLDRTTGSTLRSLNIYTTNNLQDWTNGHAAVVDINGSSGDEIVIEGGKTGRVFVLADNAAQGQLEIAYASDAPSAEAWADGSGPAVGDIDGDGNPEIVIVTTGAPGIYAYDPNHGTGCKFRWSAPAGADYKWTSPVIGDVDGDNASEVVVFSNNGILSVLSAPVAQPGTCKEGVVEWEYTVSGGSAWFTPALGQMVGGDGLDVVVATYTMLQVVDVEARDVGYWFEDLTAQFYPSVTLMPGPAQSGAPGAYLFAPGWYNGALSRLDTPANAPRPAPWAGFMGGPSRTGAR